MVTRTPALSSFPAVRGFGRGLVRFGRRKPLGGFSLVFLCIVGLVAIFPSLLTTQDPLSPDFVNNKQPPGSDFLLGSDYLGRDVFSRVIYGTRTSLTIGFAAVFFGTTLGGMWGLVSGVVGGKFDIISQRLLEVIMAFPALVLAILLVGSIGAGLMTVIIAIAATRLPFGVRVVRSVSLAVREYMYVDAARAIGASETRVILRHVLPNCVAAYIILATAHLGVAIIMEATLGFLGVGVPPPTPSWGNILGDATGDLINPVWWLVLFPGLAIIITVLAFNLLGDAVRDYLDPRLRGTTEA